MLGSVRKIVGHLFGSGGGAQSTVVDLDAWKCLAMYLVTIQGDLAGLRFLCYKRVGFLVVCTTQACTPVMWEILPFRTATPREHSELCLMSSSDSSQDSACRSVDAI